MADFIAKHISASDDVSLYVRDYPATKDGLRPVLCLSGLTRNSQDFGAVAQMLNQRGHRVVCLDYRGRGLSQFDDNWANYNPMIYVSDIFQVSAALGLHGCIVIGTSLGGLLAMAMCVVSPGLVHSVVLNDVGPDLDESGLEKIIAYTADGDSVADLEDAVEKLKKHYKDEHGFVDADWRRIAQKTYKLENGRYVPSWDVKIANNLRLSASEQQREDLWPYFLALSTRQVLLIRGAASSVFKRSTFDKMLSCLPNIVGLELQGVGHAPTLEEPEAQAAILSFLTRQ